MVFMLLFVVWCRGTKWTHETTRYTRTYEGDHEGTKGNMMQRIWWIQGPNNKMRSSQQASSMPNLNDPKIASIGEISKNTKKRPKCGPMASTHVIQNFIKVYKLLSKVSYSNLQNSPN